MSVLDIKSNILSVYRADASQHLATVQHMADAEKRLADVRATSVEEHNRGLASVMSGLEKVNSLIDSGSKLAGNVMKPVEFAITAVSKAMEFMEFASRRTRLEAAAGATDIGALSAAAGGLVSKMELLEFASKAQHAAFKLSQSQMETAQRAMRELTLEGNNQAEVTQKVTEALVKLEADGLKDFGIRVREATTDSDKFAAILEALAEKGKLVKDSQRASGEEFQALKVKFTDVADSIKTGIGKLVTALSPLLDHLAKTVGYVGTLADYAGKFSAFSIAGLKIPGTDATVGDAFRANGIDAISALGSGISQIARGANGDGITLTARDAVSPKLQLGGLSAYVGPGDGRTLAEAGPTLLQQSFDAIEGLFTALPQIAAEKERELKEDEEWTRYLIEIEKQGLNNRLDAEAEARAKFAASPEGKRAQMRALLALTTRGVDDRRELSERELGMDPSQIEAARAARLASLGEMVVPTDEFGRARDTGAELHKLIGQDYRDRLTASWNERLEAFRNGGKRGLGEGIRQTQQSELAKLFGPIEEFNVYTRALQTLEGAAKSAFGAWIDGSMSAGAAVQKFFADSLKGAATDLLGQAIVHGVYALGSLAFGDLKGAATHGAAAAKAAAGAAAIGVLAKSLHGDSPTGGGGSDHAAPLHSWSDPRGASLGAGGGTQIFVVGDPNADDSPRRRQLTFRRTQNLVVGTSGATYG